MDSHFYLDMVILLLLYLVIDLHLEFQQLLEHIVVLFLLVYQQLQFIVVDILLRERYTKRRDKQPRVCERIRRLRIRNGWE